MNTRQNEEGVRKMLDMTRLISIVLALHFYYYCYAAFEQWKLRADLSDRLLGNIQKTGIFSHPNTSKFIALGFLIISIMGERGRKEEALKFKLVLPMLVSAFCYTFKLAFTSYNITRYNFLYRLMNYCCNQL